MLFPKLKKPKSYLGMMKVEFQIDGHELGLMTLMPFGKGMLFLPINAKIRKLIKKEMGMIGLFYGEVRKLLEFIILRFLFPVLPDFLHPLLKI